MGIKKFGEEGRTRTDNVSYVTDFKSVAFQPISPHPHYVYIILYPLFIVNKYLMHRRWVLPPRVFRFGVRATAIRSPIKFLRVPKASLTTTKLYAISTWESNPYLSRSRPRAIHYTSRTPFIVSRQTNHYSGHKGTNKSVGAKIFVRNKKRNLLKL